MDLYTKDMMKKVMPAFKIITTSQHILNVLHAKLELAPLRVALPTLYAA